jgi:hypothetical protein
LLFGLYLIYQRKKTRNVFADELQANGIYKFYFAFVHSELDYFKFYKTIPAQEAFSQLKQQIPNITENSSFARHQNVAAEQHKM